MKLVGFLKRLRVAFAKRLSARRNDGNLVFQYQLARSLEPLAMQRLKSPEPSHFAHWRRAPAIISVLDEAIDKGAQCFASFGSDGSVASYLLTKTGAQLGNWYVPLTADDTVIYDVNTHPSARGERLAARLTQAVAEHAAQERGGRVFLDCAVWNVSAHRAFEAAGFARVRPEPFKPVE